jgi:hypothetical protein
MSDRTLLIVNDNDFGLENIATRFFQATFASKIE